MRIDAITTFPEMYSSVMGASMMKRAQEKGLLTFSVHDLRTWTYDVHRTTDDYPYGGGCGLLMKCDPIFEAVESVLDLPAGAITAQSVTTIKESFPETKIIFMAPHGRTFNDEMATQLAQEKQLLFICGHYEGIDERAYMLADEVISIGDYVLTSGELASMVVIDAVVRKIDGVLGAVGGAEEESFTKGLLEYPQYTRPASFRGWDVPDVLISGHHARIEEWKRQASLQRTFLLRPDMIDALQHEGALADSDVEFIGTLISKDQTDREQVSLRSCLSCKDDTEDFSTQDGKG